MASKGKGRHVYKSGAAGCGGKPAPVNSKNSGQPLPCPFCDRIFKQDGRLKEHLKSKHVDEENAGSTSSQAPSAVVVEATTTSQPSSYPVKSPKTLLHEWCQKNKRPAPKFKHVEVEGGFHCRVIVPDAKKSELDIILWYRQTTPTSQEAQHRAAIVALHHFMGNRRMDRILSEEFRKQWNELEVAAAEREEKLKANVQKARKHQVPHRELQSVFMSEGNRKLVEGVLSANSDGAAAFNVSSGGDEQEGAVLRSRLQEMGFLDIDIETALEQADDVSTALDWLMLNVEESRLPGKFAPQSSQAAVRVVQRAGANDALSSLMAYGYPRSDCVAALKETSNQESALARLFYGMLNPPASQQIDSSDVEDLAAAREEEVVALQSIYSDQAIVTTSLFVFYVPLRLESDAKLEMEVRIPAGCLYPSELPIIAFRGKGCGSACLRDITKKVADRGLELLGTPMIFELVSYAEEVAAELLSHQADKKPHQADNGPRIGDVLSSASPIIMQRQKADGYTSLEGSASENARLKAQWEELQYFPKNADAMAARRRLPAFRYRSQLLEGIKKSLVSIICGETGCGKSTQVPQYVLEESIELGKGATCNIICTQPRRISAMALAERVAKERNETIGKLVGYSVRLDSCCSKFTRLLYCTTGILLRRLLSDPNLEGITHVIVDEVHERTIESDLLLLLLRSMLKRADGRFRVILMSATIQADIFAAYFEQELGCRPLVLGIPGFTHPVRELYLEDAFEITGYKLTRNSRYTMKKRQQQDAELSTSLHDLDSWESRIEQQAQVPDEFITYSEITRRNLEMVDESIINFELIEALIYAIFRAELQPSSAYGRLTGTEDGRTLGKLDISKAGSVLVFLPGMMEIKRLQSRLQSSRELPSFGVQSRWVLALHGSLSGDEQKRVFLKPPEGVRKVVLATNVAETSITIDDVLYVIDTGRHKEMSYDHSKSLSCLQETWISKANAKQRCGRAGRVQPGCCFKLFSRKQSQALPDQQLPEILRVSLEALSLKVKSLLQTRVEPALSQMLTPPDRGAVMAALHALEDINALDEDENLTPLGQHLAQMPVDARVGKMLIFGCLLKCLDPILTVAASMSGRPVFLSPPEKRDEASTAKRRFAGSSKSDHIAIIAAYNGWQASRRGGWSSENSYCSENFLSREVLVGIEASRLDYLKVLKELGFVTTADKYQPSLDSYSNSVRVIKSVVCAGFYPHIARVRHPEKVYGHTEGGTVAKEAAAHEVHYFMKSEGRVFVHPSSVNFSVGHYESPWLVVTDRMKTSKVFLRECSMVPAYSLLVFGGKLEVMHEKQMVVVDGWLQFEAPGRIAVLIKELRKKVDSLLLDKIGNPELNISSSSVVSALLSLIETDGF